MCWGIHHRNAFKSFEKAFEDWGHQEEPFGGTDIEPEVKRRLLANIKNPTLTEVEYLVHLIRHPDIIRDEGKRLRKVTFPCDLASRAITIIGGTLYAAVRLMLLALAFGALRSAPEDLYTATWTRFLPNIS
jgi:hypothetical protein